MKFSIQGFINISKQVLCRSIVYAIPRDKRLIVYGGSKDLFIDNTKYMFIMNNESMKNFKHVWLTNREDVIQRISELGFKVVKLKTIKGFYYMLRAGFFLFDDSITNFSKQGLSFGAVRIQLWHGIPAKWVAGVKQDKPDFYHRKSWFWETYVFDHLHGDYAVTTSHAMDNIYSAMFRIPREKLFLGGYPRLSTFFMYEEQRIEWIKKYETKELFEEYNYIKSLVGRKVVYMPTFRDKKPEYMTEAIPNWNDLNEYCRVNDVHLFVKVHRAAKMLDISDFSNIIILSNELDIYPLLPLFDMMISDYSSVTYDFSVLKKKIVMYTYDMEEYLTKSRPVPDYFKNIIYQLTNVKTFTEFKDVLTIDIDTLNDFPDKHCFDAPQDYKSIQSFIRHYYN